MEHLSKVTGIVGLILALALPLLAVAHRLLPQETGGAIWLPAEGPEATERRSSKLGSGSYLVSGGIGAIRNGLGTQESSPQRGGDIIASQGARERPGESNTCSTGSKYLSLQSTNTPL